MATLTKGRSEPPCKDNVGGVKTIYIFPFVDYTYSQIVGTRGVELTSFPATDIYEFGIASGSMTEDINNDEDGLYYDQNVTFSLKKQDVITTYELTILEKQDLRYIVLFNNGTYKIGGLFNGAKFEFSTVSGDGKQELNGYNCTLKSKEEYQSAYIANLSNVGFTIVEILLLEDFDALLMDNNDKIILE